jgi:hypothetical protein
MLGLSALANWEVAVLESIGGARGSVEERDAQITRSGMYAEYPAIFAGYLELVLDSSEQPVVVEALKRAVFLAWIATQAPPTESGIAELPESSVRGLMRALDDAIASGGADDELRAMLAWYHGRSAFAFEHFGPFRALEGFIGPATTTEIAALARDQPRFAGRGQLGRYWSGLRLESR